MTVGKGDITVMTKRGKRTIKDVFLVPGLEKNLLSVPQIISSGYRVLFEDKRCIILDPMGKNIMDIPMKHKSFRITWNLIQEMGMVVSEQETMDIWHRRFGHVGNSRLQQMQNKKLVKWFTKVSSQQGDMWSM